MINSKQLLAVLLGATAMSVAAPMDASTIFITNNTSPKTLASNEGDAGTGLTNGTDNDGLNQDKTGDTTVLTLSADDGGGTISLTSTEVNSSQKLFMDGDSMGHANDKWGSNQNWTFTFDQTISFDALTFKTINETMTLKSTAWVGDANATGTNWSFNGTTGEFSINGTSDFTGAGVSDVASGTEIVFGFFASSGGGEELTSFTITPIPEPSSLALLGLGSLMMIKRRRRGCESAD